MTTECRRSKIFQWAEKRFCTCVSAATGAVAVSASLKKTLFSLATTVLPADLSLQLLPRSVIRFPLPGSERNIMYPAQLPCATSSALVSGLQSFPKFFLWTSSRATLAFRSITALLLIDTMSFVKPIGLWSVFGKMSKTSSQNNSVNTSKNPGVSLYGNRGCFILRKLSIRRSFFILHCQSSCRTRKNAGRGTPWRNSAAYSQPSPGIRSSQGLLPGNCRAG